MPALEGIDIALFRFINETLRNPLCDLVMPVLAGGVWFWPLLGTLMLAAIWKGGARGRLGVLFIIVLLPIGDSWLVSMLKEAIGRARPCAVLDNVHLPAGWVCQGPFALQSMPSGHAMNWFAATLIVRTYFPRLVPLMLGIALTVAFSRVYNGVHFPSDVLAGAALGAGYAAAALVIIQTVWQFVTRRCFPLCWARMPSLLCPESRAELMNRGVSRS